MTLSVAYRDEYVDLSLPQKMSELPDDIWGSSLFVSAVLSMDDVAMRMAILAHTYPSWYARMSAQQISDIIGAWEIQMDYDHMKPMRGWRYFYLHYIAPPVDFRTGTLREFIYMHEYLEEMDTVSLAALLYRYPDPNRADALRRDDKRVRLISRDQVELWAHNMRRHKHKKMKAMQASALLYSVGVKQLVYSMYGSRLFTGEATTSHNLGWTAVAMQIAEHQTFGDYESVLDTTLHEVLAYMLVKKSESESQTNKTHQEE
jgi:hypothetical protein